MNPELESVLKRVQADAGLLSKDEASMKQSVILPILSAVGWDVFNVDEVCPEYSVEARRVDYALCHRGTVKFFIEAKRPTENLEKHQKQLLNYSFGEGVKLALLTNGLSWWFYLPLREGSWEQRKFYTVEIENQTLEEVGEKLESLLSRERVVTGDSVKAAEDLAGTQKRITTISATLPRAWMKLLSDPEGELMELFAETTEKICGFRPDAETVEQFLARQIGKGATSTVPVALEETKNPPTKKVGDENVTGRKPKSFTLRGETQEVSAWIEILSCLCLKFSTERPEQFDSVLRLRGKKRPYFTRNIDELRTPIEISGTGIYFETNLAATQIVKLSRRLIAQFGYDAEEFLIELA